MPVCSKCGSMQPDGAVFCGNCGTELQAQTEKRRCPHCNSELAADMRFCDKCGTRYPDSPHVHTYAPTSKPSAPSHSNTQEFTYTNTGETRAPEVLVVNTTTLTVLSAICIILFWPVACYGFYCRSRALKTDSQEEANRAITQGTRACMITLGVFAALLIISALLAGY